MRYRRRLLEAHLRRHLGRGKSVLLLGPRQTGKSTLLAQLDVDLSINLAAPAIRQRYERAPELLTREVEAMRRLRPRRDLVIALDEVQKVPALLDGVQDLIDRRIARFVLCGSSARKLRRGADVNLLPGRVAVLRLDPFVVDEMGKDLRLSDVLIYGSLPGIVGEAVKVDREFDLKSYVETYLEEEVRAEGLVRNIGKFSRFLELAGLESGQLVSFRAIAQDVGVAHTTIAANYEVLEDCLVAERVEPLTRHPSRKKLIRSSRYVIFDLGVRRHCAGEGIKLGAVRLGQLFEQFVGLELLRHSRLATAKLWFWRDADGPEVDWVLEREGELIPIEVKWSDRPGARDTRHLEVFIEEYAEASRGFVVCQTERTYRITDNVTAVSWRQIAAIVGGEL